MRTVTPTPSRLAARSSPTAAPVASRNDVEAMAVRMSSPAGGAHRRYTTGRAVMNPPIPPPFEPATVTGRGICLGRWFDRPDVRLDADPVPARAGVERDRRSSRRPRPGRSRGSSWTVTGPVDRDLAGGRHLQVDACEADRTGDRDRAAADLGRQRDDDALVVAIDASLAAGDAMQPAVAVDEVGMHGDAGPVARHRAGVGRIRCRGERGVERDLETPGCAGDVDRGGRRSSGASGRPASPGSPGRPRPAGSSGPARPPPDRSKRSHRSSRPARRRSTRGPRS